MTIRCLILFGLFLVTGPGCQRGPYESGLVHPYRSTDPYRPLMQRLPLPAVERIVYKNGILKLYPLPESGRWLVYGPGSRDPVPVGLQHHLPSGVDAASTWVYYCHPGGQTSEAVSLTQIEAAGKRPNAGIP